MTTDERDTIITYLAEGLKMCNGICSTCPTRDPIIVRDEKLYEFDTFVRETIEERGYSIETGNLPENLCPLGIALGRMIKDQANKDTSTYKKLILSAGGDIICSSIKEFNPHRVKKYMTLAMIDLNGSKREVPPVEAKPRKSTTVEMPIELQQGRMSTSVKRLLNY